MKKVLLLAMVIIGLGVTKVDAQKNSGDDYSTAIGIKFYPTALSVKHFVGDDNAIEGLGYFWNYGFRITGLYEFHHDLGDVEGLKWYVGPGLHFSTYNAGYYNGGSTVGIDGVLGLDYKFEDAPINISVDFQPSLDLGSGYGGLYGWGGLGIRYAF